MTVYEISIPGSFLDMANKDHKFKAQILIRILEDAFYEANLALNLFNQRQHIEYIDSNDDGLEKWRNRRDERWAIEEKLKAERNCGTFDMECNNAVRYDADIIYKREQWAKGIPPKRFSTTLLFVYARTFLYALDNFDRTLEQLSKQEGVPAKLKAMHSTIAQIFPDLREVRNTAHHLEDRALGLDRKKLIDLKPISAGGISTGGNIVVSSHLDGSTYGCTMKDGEFGQVDVTAESLATLGRLLQDVINTFQWTGDPQHLPY